METAALVTPSNLPVSRDETEIVVFVGPPWVIPNSADTRASGKTSFFRRHFKSYQHINQDTLKTRDRCVKVAREHVSKGQAVIIDNTNRDKATRRVYLELAKELGVPIRLVMLVHPLTTGYSSLPVRSTSHATTTSTARGTRRLMSHPAPSSQRARTTHTRTSLSSPH